MQRSAQIGTASLLALVLGFSLGVVGSGGTKRLLGLDHDASDTGPVVAEVLGAVEERSEPVELVAPGSTRTFRYGDEELQVLDLIRSGATPLDEPQPVIVYLHSGGWTSGSRVNLPDFVAAQGMLGWTVVSADYRLAPDDPFPAANEDVDRLLRWVQLHAERLGVDPGRVVLAGSSAGGHLAVTAAAWPGRFVAPDLPDELLAVEPLVAAVVAAVPPTNLAALIRHPDEPDGTNMVAGTTLAYLDCTTADACDPETVFAATPQLAPDLTPPPLLLLYGELDDTAIGRREGELLRVEWEAAGAEVVVAVAPGLGHNLALDEGIDPALLVGFLDDHAG